MGYVREKAGSKRNFGLLLTNSSLGGEVLSLSLNDEVSPDRIGSPIIYDLDSFEGDRFRRYWMIKKSHPDPEPHRPDMVYVLRAYTLFSSR